MDKHTICSAFSSEEGQIWSYLLKAVLVIVIVGFLIIQCAPIIRNHITIGSTADDAADYAASSYQDNRGNMKEVQEETEEYMRDVNLRLDGAITVDVDSSGKASMIHVPVRRIVNTYLFKNIIYLASYTEASAEGKADIF